MKTYSSKLFTYLANSDTFVAEASCLHFFDGQSFYIRSERTGDTRLFLVDRREFTNGPDREFVAWHGVSPGNGHKFIVFND